MSISLKKLVDGDPMALIKLPLQISAENALNLKDARKELSRSYSSVEVYTDSFIKNTALWLTSNHCSKLCILKFSFMDFKMGCKADMKLWEKTLLSLHNLKDLTMIHCGLNGGYCNVLEPLIQPVKMERLNKITFRFTHLAVSS